MPEAPEVRPAYDGSALSFRLLRACGWGPLANLGFYPLWALPLLIGGLGFFQRELARRAIRLLDPQPGEFVLDAAAGAGWSARQIRRSGARVLGVDLLPESVAAARNRYPSATGVADPGLTFGVADVTRLPNAVAGVALEAEGVDRILCLEAAFHFGPKGRHAFLGEAFRLLRPGGRLVLVDFVWPDERPAEIETLDPGRIVRDTWRFDEFEPLSRYRSLAREYGFRETQLLDWTAPVTGRFVSVGWGMAWLCQSRPLRLLLSVFRPSLFQLWSEDWPPLLELMRAHQRVQRGSRYMALVFEKPKV